eukprot:403337-Amphidinium_carterae.1
MAACAYNAEDACMALISGNVDRDADNERNDDPQFNESHANDGADDSDDGDDDDDDDDDDADDDDDDHHFY